MTEPTPAPQGTAVVAKPQRKLDLQAIGASPVGGGAMFLPSTMQECVDFASIMSRSDFAIPPKFRNNPGACLAITIQASRWQADPFGVIQKAYVVKAADQSERIAYEAQLVAAVVNTRAGLAGRLELIYSGEGDTRKVKVIGTFADTGEKREIETPPVKKCKKKSPLWESDPDQQLAYYGMRAWGRRWTPEVLLGIYTPDELQDVGLVDQPRPARPSAAPAPAAITEGIVVAPEPEPPVQAEETIEDMIPARDPGPQTVEEPEPPITTEEAAVIDEVRVPATDGPNRAATAAAEHGIAGEGLEVPPVAEVQPTVLDQWEANLEKAKAALMGDTLRTEDDFDAYGKIFKEEVAKAEGLSEDERDDLRARFVSALLTRKRDLGFGRRR